MKKVRLSVLLLIMMMSFTLLPAQIFSPGIRFAPAFSGGIGGTETSNNIPGVGFEAGVFCSIRINENLVFIPEVNYTQKNFYYETKSESYGTGRCNIGFPAIQIPFVLEWTIKDAFKTTGTLGIYVGENICFIVADQRYKDSSGSFCGNFLSPTINIGLLFGSEFLYTVGPVLFGFDLRFMFDLLENEINYRGNIVRTGRLLHFIPSVSVRMPLK